jgi:hypothetical protein
VQSIKHGGVGVKRGKAERLFLINNLPLTIPNRILCYEINIDGMERGNEMVLEKYLGGLRWSLMAKVNRRKRPEPKKSRDLDKSRLRHHTLTNSPIETPGDTL